MSTDVLAYLAGKGLFLKRAPGDEVHLPCFFCGEDGGKRGRLYINVDVEADIPGLFSCKLCGAHGALPTIQRHFGDVTEKQEREDDGFQRRAVLAAASEYYHAALGEHREAMRWLRDTRGLTLDTIMTNQLGFADGGLFRHLREMEFRISDIVATGLVQENRNTHKLGDFLDGHITIPYWTNGNVVMIRGRDLAGGDRKYLTPHGQKTRLFNADVTWEADEIVVCYADDTEVLTPRGWHRLAALPTDLPVAAWSLDGRITWEVPRAYQKFRYEGHMVSYAANFSDLLVTPDHRVVSRSPGHAPTVRPAQAHVGALNRQLPVAGVLMGGEGPSRLEARLIAMVAADGGWTPRGGGALFNLKKSRKKDRLRSLLTRYGLSQRERPGQGAHDKRPGWSEGTHDSAPGWTQFLVHGLEFVHQYLGGKGGKQLTWEMLAWSLEARQSFLGELGYWDGDLPGREGVRFFTADQQSAEVVTAIAGISGWGAIVRADKRPDRDDTYVVSLVPRDWRQMGNAPHEVEGYDGHVYCLTVPTGFLLTRRNGKVTVSGNCEGEFDALILCQIGIPAVAVPGANTWQDSWDAYFTETRRLYVVFDNDDAGTRGAEKVANRFAKARVVAMPENNPGEPKVDVSEFIVAQGHTAEDFKALLSRAGGGLLVTVDDAIAEHAELQGQVGLRFGVGQLDLYLEPGLLKSQVMVFLAKSGVGKGHPLDTEVPTPGGLRRWGDLEVGDEVFGRDGLPTKVLDVFDRGVLPTYRVSFSDKTEVLVDAEHLWNVRERFGKRRDWVEKTMATTDVLVAGLRRGAEYRFTIPMAEPVECPVRSLPIEPYTLGAILANGYLKGSSVCLTTPDYEVVARVRRHYNVAEVQRRDAACPAFTIHCMIGTVRRLGLNVGSSDKFIPEKYLTASIDQRSALLQGMMDGDGSCRARSGRRGVLYFTTSNQLAGDLVRLVTSLGGTAMVRWYRRGACRPDGVVSIMLPPQIAPFGTQRKRREVEVKHHSEPRRAIVAIDRVADQPIRCIRVDAHDSLYLIGRSHVVTHNTIFLLNLFQWIANEQPEAKILFFSLEQTRGDWWERARRIYRFWHPGSSDTDAHHFWRDRLLLVDRNRVTLDQFMTCLEDFKDEMGCKPDLVGVDYLGYFAQGFKGERYERTADAVMALKAIAKDERLAIVTPHQVNRMTGYGSEPSVDAARDSGVVEETADFVFPLWSLDTQKGRELEQRTGEFKLKIGKSRHGGVGHAENFWFAPLSLAIVPDNRQEAAIWARNELHYQTVYKCHWQDALVRHEAGTPKDEANWAVVERAFWRKRQQTTGAR